MCGIHEETSLHVMRTCRMASEVWIHTQMQEKWRSTEDDDIFQWLIMVSEKLDQNSFEFGLIILWAIWNNRNAFIMQGKRRNSQDVSRFATSYLQDYKQAIAKMERQKQRGRQIWEKPPQDVIKLNFDGSVQEEARKGGIGVIARNDKGEVLGSVQTFVRGTTDPSAIEAHAAYEAYNLLNIWVSLQLFWKEMR